ncbi:MAG: hypothetical protein WCG99_05225 [Candidatus Berkelbacteria bacterium]
METWFREHPEEVFTVNFANTSYAHLESGDPLSKRLKYLARSYRVEVFSMHDDKYHPWTGARGDCFDFDAIRITAKKA